MSAVDARVVGNGHQFALGLGAVTVPAVMNLVQKATSAHLAPNGSSSGAKLGPPTAPTSGLSNQRTSLATQPRVDGVVVGEQHEVVVHLTEGVVAGVGPVSRRVVNPRGAVLFAHGLGVVLGFGVSDDELKVRVVCLPSVRARCRVRRRC